MANFSSSNDSLVNSNKKKKCKKLTAYKLASYSYGSTSSEESDLKDLIETLKDFEVCVPRDKFQQSIKNAYPEDICYFTSDENSLYETATSDVSSTDSQLHKWPYPMRSKISPSPDGQASDNSLFDDYVSSSDDNGDTSVDNDYMNDVTAKIDVNNVSSSTNSSKSERNSINTCLDYFHPQYHGKTKIEAKRILVTSSEGNESRSLDESYVVVGVPETTIDEGITRIVPMKFAVDKNGTPSKQLMQQAYSSEETLSEKFDINSIKSRNNVLVKAKTSKSESRSSLSSESARIRDDKLNFTYPDSETPPKLRSSDQSSSSCSIAIQNSTKSSCFESDNAEAKRRLQKKQDYRKMLEFLNFRSSEESDVSSETSKKCPPSDASSKRTSTNSSLPNSQSSLITEGMRESQSHSLVSNSESETKQKSIILRSVEGENDSNTASSQSDQQRKNVIKTETNASCDEKVRKLERDTLLFASLTELDSSSSDTILKETDFLNTTVNFHHLKTCEHHDFSALDFNKTELNITTEAQPGLQNDVTSTTTSSFQTVRQPGHHHHHPNERNTVDKILRLGHEDVVLNNRNTHQAEPRLANVNGTVFDSELQSSAVDYTRPRSIDEDTFYWVPCDFKEFLQISDRPLASDYFPKNSTSQFCCLMVREFVHVHLYLRLHPKSQSSYAKYNILIWDKMRHPVAHFRSPCPIFFQPGTAHHVATFSDQPMQELLAQEIIVVSCHVSSFAKWEKEDDKNTPWFFSNGVHRLKSADQMASLYCSHEYSDVTLESSDGQKYPAHRAVICRESQLLKLNVDLSSSATVKVNIRGRLLKQMLHVFYTGEFPLVEKLDNASVELPRWQEMCELLVASDRFLAERLSRKCQAWLSSALSQENVCTVYALSVRLGLASLTNSCRHYIKKHRETVVKSMEWLTLKDSPSAVADLLLNTDIYGGQGGREELKDTNVEYDNHLYCLNEFTLAPSNYDKKLSFKDILYEFGYATNP